KNMLVGTARKAGADGFPHFRPRAIAAGEIARLMIVLAAVGPAQPRGDAVCRFGKAQKLGLSLNADTGRLEPLCQELLVLVLRKDMQERVGCRSLADALK